MYASLFKICQVECGCRARKLLFLWFFADSLLSFLDFIDVHEADDCSINAFLFCDVGADTEFKPSMVVVLDIHLDGSEFADDFSDEFLDFFDWNVETNVGYGAADIGGYKSQYLLCQWGEAAYE